MSKVPVTASDGANWKLKTSLIIAFILLTAYRLLLSRSGQLYWPDEYRYLHAMHFMDELYKGSLSAGLKWIFGSTFDVAARPGFMFLAMIPVFFQGLAHLLFDIQPSDQAFFRIPAIFNVAVSLGVAVLIYRILFVLSGDRALALVGVVVHGLLVNTNLYVRHLFPYDWALLILLAALNVILSPGMARDRPRYQAVVAGLLAGIGATTYTPYSPLVVILVAALIVVQAGHWRYVPTFVTAILSVIVMWELVARMGGFSYVGRLTEFTAVVVGTSVDVQGSFGGPIFLPFYLLRVEGVAGVVLLGLFVWFWIGAAKGKHGQVEVAIIGTATAVYLFYGTMALYSHNYIFFFGRLLHMYFPFVVVGAILAVKVIPGFKLRTSVMVAMVLASIVSFVPTAAKALAINYPRDVARELIASLAPGAKTCYWVRDDAGRIEESAVQCTIADAKALVIHIPRDVGQEQAVSLAPKIKICARLKDHRGKVEDLTSDCNLVLDNFRHLYPPSLEVADATPPAGFKQSAVYAHTLQFAPYWLEDFSPDARAYLATHQPEMRVYVRAVP